jgi:hypothetical protein
VGGGSVLWAETPDDDEREEPAETEGRGAVDESFAARRLRRWLRGMFGGKAAPEGEEAPEREPKS